MCETFIQSIILMTMTDQIGVFVFLKTNETDSTSQTSLTMQTVMLMRLTIFTMWCFLSCQLYYFESLRLRVTCCLSEGLLFLFQSNPQTDRLEYDC